jgi:hypothetical protein
MKPTEFKKAATSCKNQDELSALILSLSGTDNRFVRQEICNDLTGESIPIVKAGISHLKEYTETWLKSVIAKADAPKADEPKAEKPIIIIGMKVTRKECKREGVVSAMEGEKLMITLADGDVRRPNVNRFQKLYTWN